MSDCFDCDKGECNMNCGPVATTGDASRARRAIDALQRPDPAFARVPNTVRQSVAEVIEELLSELAAYRADPAPPIQSSAQPAAERVEPVYGWAAVAPDGRIDFWSLHPDRDGARFHTARRYMGPSYGSAEEGWSKAEGAGWRVIRVQISPAFDHKDKQA